MKKYFSLLLVPIVAFSFVWLVAISVPVQAQTTAIQTQSWAATQCPVGYTCQQMNQTTLPVCPAGLTCTPMTTTAVPSQPAVVNYTPTIISVNGTTPLVVGEAGSWTIQASDPQNGPLTYSVDWGDSTSLSTSVSTSRSTTLYHTYASVGAYTPTFTVTDSDGLKAASSILVQVSASITTAAAFVPPAVAIGAIGAPVFTVTTQGNTTGYTAATFPMTFTVTSGTMPVYISATPASAVVLSSYVPGSLTSNLLPASNVSAVSLDGGAAVSGDTNQGSGPQATGSYIVPAGATRTFTVNVKLNNAGNGSVVSNAVTGISAIYYSQNSTPAGSVTAKYLESPFTSNLGNVQTPPVTLLGIGNQ